MLNASFFFIVFLPLIFGVWLWRRATRQLRLPLGRVLLVVVAGGFGAALAMALERWLLQTAGIELGTARPLATGLFTVILAGPLEEGVKAAAIWPLYSRRQLTRGKVGATYGVLTAAGFATIQMTLWLLYGGEITPLSLARLAIALPAHFFFAGVWGYILGGGRRDRYFVTVWFACALLHGCYDYVVFWRQPAFLIVVLPMLIMMGLGVVGVLRDRPQRQTRVTAYSLLDVSTPQALSRVMKRQERPIMLHWIFFGALVSLGVSLVFLVAAVYLGKRAGIDFSLVEANDFRGILPIALLGTALLLSFPFSAYLVAKASGAVSVFEPAWATGMALVAVLALFSVTEPTALVITLAIAPVGFALACAGAWFGLGRGD
ncbi:MAG: PrsW family intramembrane metalloprotease [Polyangiaceae bacterium]|nr:PrsW family intramembrane metalloprotease [Polyangiaceae bacterium]